MKFLFFITLLGIALPAELLFGSLALPPVFSAAVIYYIALAGSFPAALASALIFGAVLDLTYGRLYPMTAIILIAALIAGGALRRKPAGHPFELALPGLGVALAAVLTANLAEIASASVRPGMFELSCKLFFFGACGILILPIGALLADLAGWLLGIQGAIRQEKGHGEGRIPGRRPRLVREPRTEGKKQ